MKLNVRFLSIMMVSVALVSLLSSNTSQAEGAEQLMSLRCQSKELPPCDTLKIYEDGGTEMTFHAQENYELASNAEPIVEGVKFEVEEDPCPHPSPTVDHKICKQNVVIITPATPPTCIAEYQIVHAVCDGGWPKGSCNPTSCAQTAGTLYTGVDPLCLN